MRTNPRPTQGSIGYYYPDDYGPYRNTVIRERTWFFSVSELLRLPIKKVIRFNSTRLPRIPVGRMMEIGCASGAFLERMAREGWTVEGIEFSSNAADCARVSGHKVFCGRVEDAPDPRQLFDLVVAWMVVEHLFDPVSVLKKLCKWVKPEGWLVFSVPNAASIEFKLFRKNWYALHLPNHLYHFTPETLRKVVNKGGWEIEKVFHQRTLANLIGSLGYWLADRNKLKSLAKKMSNYPEKSRILPYFLYPLSYLFSLFGQTGRMTVWAKKKHD